MGQVAVALPQVRQLPEAVGATPRISQVNGPLGEHGAVIHQDTTPKAVAHVLIAWGLGWLSCGHVEWDENWGS